MEKRFWVLVFLAVVLVGGVGAFAPVEQEIDENNPTERFRNSFVLDEGTIRLDKSLQNIPYTLVSDVYWGEDEFPKKIIFKDFRVKNNLEIEISNKDLLVSTAKEFLKKYPELGINIDNLEATDVYAGSEFFSVASASPTPTPSPTTSPSPSPTVSPTTNVYPSQQLATVFFKEFLIDGNGQKRYVAGSFVTIAFKIGDDNVQRIVAFKGNYYSEVSIIPTSSILSEEDAVESARTYLGSIDEGYLTLNKKSIKLVFYPVNNGKNLILAYEILFEEKNVRGHMEKNVVIINAIDGNLFSYYNLLKYGVVSGRVSGSIYPENPIKGIDNNVGFMDEDVKVRNGVNYIKVKTGANGVYSADVENPAGAYSQLMGDWAWVIDYQLRGTPQGRIMADAGNGYNINWKDFDTSYKQEWSNAFYHTNIMHDFATQPHINAEKMNFQTNVLVNYLMSCNAYYDPSTRSIVFFKKGKSDNYECEATSLFADSIYHEYGHSIIDSLIMIDDELFPYLGETGNLDEGIADYSACIVKEIQKRSEPACLYDFEFGKENTCFRRCDSDDKYPEKYTTEPHSGAQIISGALWDLKDKMISRYGNDVGFKKAVSLAYSALRFQPTSFADYLDGIIMADDDNGNPDDGSPNREEICNAFVEHGIQSAYCAGVGFPNRAGIALIHTPKLYYIGIDGFISDGVFDIVGTVVPGKSNKLEEWILIIEDKENGNILFSTKGNEAVRKGVLGSYDFSKLRAGHKYTIKLTIKEIRFLDIPGLADVWKHLSSTTTLDFIKSNKVIIKFNNPDEKYTHLGIFNRPKDRVWIRISENMAISDDTEDFYCKEKECQFKFWLPRDEADIIIRVSKSSENTNPAERRYIFFKKYSHPNSLILDILKTKQIETNAENILQNYDALDTHIGIYKKDGISSEEIISDWWLSFIPKDSSDFYNFQKEKLNLEYDSNLLFNDYLLYHRWTGADSENKKIINTGYILQYPFGYNGKIDESQIRNIKIDFFNPSSGSNLGILIYSNLFYSTIETGTWRERTLYAMGRIEASPGIYDFSFLPKINGKNIVYIIGGGVIGFGFFEVYRYNGPGTSYYNAPAELTTDISLFKEPLFLTIKAEDFVKDYLLNNELNKVHLLRGLVSDSFPADGGIISDFGKLEITLPDKTIEIIPKKKFFNDQTSSTWAIDCVSGGSYPDILNNKQKFCQKGEYKVYWEFGDRDDNGAGDIFADGRILRLKATYSFDGKRFTIKEQSSTTDYRQKFIRGDANNDGKVDMSDAIRILEMLFQNGELMKCLDAGDVNDDGMIDISDAIYILLYLFNGGKEPPAPFSEAGIDMSEDSFYCQ